MFSLLCLVSNLLNFFFTSYQNCNWKWPKGKGKTSMACSKKVSYLGFKNSLLFAVLFLQEVKTKIHPVTMVILFSERQQIKHSYLSWLKRSRIKKIVCFPCNYLWAHDGALPHTVFWTAPPNEQIRKLWIIVWERKPEARGQKQCLSILVMGSHVSHVARI